jgi:hypothetical protein
MTYLPDLPDIDADFTEFNPDANLEAIRQEHEPFLTRLEGLAVQAIARGNWTPVLEHLNEIMAWQDGKLHEAQKSKASADSLTGSSADAQTTQVNESKD